MKKVFSLSRIFALAWWAAALLTACGGGGGGNSSSVGTSNAGDNTLPPIKNPSPPSPLPIAGTLPISSGTLTLQVGAGAAPAAAPLATSVNFQPAFHMLPVVLDEPDDQDRHDNRASVNRPPQQIAIPTENAGLSTRRLTLQDIRAQRNHFEADGAGRAMAPMLAPASASVYTPAQIRAAYGLPALPPVGTKPTAAQAASMGAGQTIYILVAYHDPNVAAELAAFNTKYGLPVCTTAHIPVTEPLPLSPASTVNPGCTLSVVYADWNGNMVSTPPNGYDEKWGVETALDVQWAHATAPLARIVLIESINNILASIGLANAMGPGIVSMSFGSAEGDWNAEWESYFEGGSGMTYLAATGDAGPEVNWPAVSPHVVAVGGTTLSYAGNATRSETVWSGTGGGISAYMPTPAYQKLSVQGLGRVGYRSVADVALNSNPATGQPVAVMPPGNTAPRWLVVGGTSLATPEWAGIFAIANAMRAAANKAPLGEPHAKLYAMAATSPLTYANVFSDIATGSHGSCVLCAARAGYDQPTGLGTPNASAMLNFLADAPSNLEVTPARITVATGVPLSFTVSVDSPNPLTYSLSGAPAGLSMDANGVATWPVPVVGTYALTVTASDPQTKLQGSGVYTITIAAPAAPAVSASTVYGMPGSALAFPVIYTAGALEPLTFSLSGAPAGMAISSTGTVSWAKPVLGSYKVTVNVKNSKSGLSGSAIYTVTVQTTAPAPAYPLISAPPMAAVAGRAVSGAISFTDPDATSLSVSLSGAPMGLNFFVRGMSIGTRWAKPVAGSYSIRINTVDDAGRKATATLPLVVTAQ